MPRIKTTFRGSAVSFDGIRLDVAELDRDVLIALATRGAAQFVLDQTYSRRNDFQAQRRQIRKAVSWLSTGNKPTPTTLR